MEITRKIVIRQNPNFRKSQILQLYNSLVDGDWYPFDENRCVHFKINNEKIQSIPVDDEGISKQLADVEKAQENYLPISIQFLNKINKRNLTLSHKEDEYVFHFEIRNFDNEYEIFRELHLSIKKSIPEKFYLNRIEWKNNPKEEIVRLETDLYHEGVLILASSNQLKSFYSSNQFNYDFPKGLEELLESNSIIAINAYDWGFETIIDLDNIEENKKAITSSISVEGKSIKSHLFFEGEDDELLLLNNADFTMICNKYNGDYEKYGWKHIISIPMDSIGNREVKIWREMTKTNSKVIFKLDHSKTNPVKNELINIEKIPTHNNPPSDHLLHSSESA